MRKQKKQTIQVGSVLRADLLLYFVRVFDLIRHPVLRSRHAMKGTGKRNSRGQKLYRSPSGKKWTIRQIRPYKAKKSF